MPDPSDTFEHRLKQNLDSLLAPPPFDAQRDREILAAARSAYGAPKIRPPLALGGGGLPPASQPL